MHSLLQRVCRLVASVWTCVVVGNRVGAGSMLARSNLFEHAQVIHIVLLLCGHRLLLLEYAV